MKTFLAIVCAVVFAAVVAVELGAETIATRLIDEPVRRHLDADVSVTSVDRPVSPSLVFGRVTGVEVESPRAVYEGIELTQVRARADEVALPWAEPIATDVTFQATLAEDAVRTLLADVLERVPVEVGIELVDDGVRLSNPSVPGSATVAVEVDQGQVRLSPGGSAPEWIRQFGVDVPADLPDGLTLTEVDLQHGQVHVHGELSQVMFVAAAP